MKIIVAGGTGFIGRYLIAALLREQHQVIVLGRELKRIKNIYDQHVTALTWKNFNEFDLTSIDAIINLTGRNIGGYRWFNEIKKSIKQSRVGPTSTIVNRLLETKTKKPHLYNASAIGVYGLQQSSPSSLPYKLTEASPILFGHPTDFLSEVGQDWEQAVRPAVKAEIPVTIMRFGVVLKRGEGMLAQLTPSFKFGLGAKIGSGHQALTWIHVDDLVRSIIFLLQRPEITGPINLCAPECVNQYHFTKTLGVVMQRPTFLSLPSWLIKFIFGQMGEELLLGGQNVYPQRLISLGFSFSYPTLKQALTHDWHH